MSGRLPAAMAASAKLCIDWLEFSARGLSVERLMEWMGQHLGVAFARDAVVVERDDEAVFVAKGVHEVRVMADRVGQEDRNGQRHPWAGVRLPGLACRAAGTGRLLNLLWSVIEAKKGLKISRLDMAIDDEARTFDPRTFAEACVGPRLDSETAMLLPGVVTRVQGSSWEWSRRLGGCFWLGGKGAERRIRVYDKDLESGGLIRGVRLEMQNRNRFATELGVAMVDVWKEGGRLAPVILGRLLGFVDLRVPQVGHVRRSAWPRVSFWAAFVGKVGAVRVPKEDPSGAEGWWRGYQKQAGAGLNVRLRYEGIDEAAWEALVDSKGSEDPVIRAVASVLGARGLRPLNPREVERLRQLRLAGDRLS
ncbi:MAG: replication initiation factor domain-containing protein [Planctomycetota bacterium]|nr:replication initiation factor domain-containing protein [Planctomycetota bacterium]